MGVCFKSSYTKGRLPVRIIFPKNYVEFMILLIILSIHLLKLFEGIYESVSLIPDTFVSLRAPFFLIALIYFRIFPIH